MRYPATLLALLFLGASCHDDDVGDYIPPKGLGALTIDNNTATDLDVFINGRSAPRVKNGRIQRYDLAPGEHRVILRDDEGVYDSWFSDVDILEGHQTILDVETETFGDDFDVRVFLD